MGNANNYNLSLDSQNVMYYIFNMGDTFAGSANGISRATGFDGIALIF